MYDDEKRLMGKEFEVTKPWNVSNCKMKKGDILKVIDYGSGMATHYVQFKNKRLPAYKFSTGTSVFKSNTRKNS